MCKCANDLICMPVKSERVGGGLGREGKKRGERGVGEEGGGRGGGTVAGGTDGGMGRGGEGQGLGEASRGGRCLICMLTCFRTYDFCHFFNFANIEKMKCQKIKSHSWFFRFSIF